MARARTKRGKQDENGLTANDRRRLENALWTLIDFEGAIRNKSERSPQSVNDVAQAIRQLTRRGE